LSANVETIGSPDLSYVWAIKSGSDYAELATSNALESVVLQGKNATATEQSVKVKVTVTDRTNGYTYADSVEICVGAAASSVSSVSITGTSSIAYNGTGTLTAQASTIGNPSISYSWQITSGSDYASISGDGASVTITGRNTDTAAHTVTVQVTATNDEDSANTVTSAAYSINVTKNGDSVADKIGSVQLTASASSISASGSCSFTASTTDNTGNPTITYSWQITDGGDYASITSDGESATLTGANTDTVSHTVTVTVTATNSADSSNAVSASTTVTVAPATVDSDTLYLNLTSGTVSADGTNYVAITTSANEIATNIKVKYTEDSDGASTGLIRVNAKKFEGELTVYITGTMTTGGVKIQSNGTDTVNVVLNGAAITSSSYPCLEVTKGSAAVITLTGTNTFVDGRAYGTGYGEEYSTTSGATYVDDDDQVQTCTVSKSVVSEGSDSKGTLYCKGDLTVSGSGSLTVTQAYKNCIASKDGTLTIDGGTLTLQNYLSDSTKTSATGKNGLFGGAGLVVNDGTISFTGYGIISTSDLRKANAFKTDDEDYPSSAVTINGGTITVSTYNGKGITAPYVNITGGTSSFAVTGVTTYAERTSTGSYYDADGVYCSNQTIKFAAEGIESAYQTKISGGTVEVTATDDALNVSNSSGTFYLTGGSLYDYSSGGDGIDCNGNIYLQGGVVVSYAPTGSEDAFDCGDSNNKIYITGGTIAGTCGSSNAISDYSTSGQKVLYFTGSSSGMSGSNRPGQSSSSSSTSFSKVAVQMSGSTKYAFSLPSSSFGLFVMSCASFTSSSSSSYSVYTAPTISSSDFHGLCTSSSTLTAVSTGSTTKTPSIK
nr:carbohydrate-binding domain-containing protein [Treponema sp.]